MQTDKSTQLLHKFCIRDYCRELGFKVKLEIVMYTLARGHGGRSFWCCKWRKNDTDKNEQPKAFCDKHRGLEFFEPEPNSCVALKLPYLE